MLSVVYTELVFLRKNVVPTQADPANRAAYRALAAPLEPPDPKEQRQLWGGISFL